MKAETWIALGSLAVSLAALLWTLWKGRQASEANLHAIEADARAEEALAVAKSVAERDNQRFESEKADLEAPQIADRWVGEIQYQWGMHSRMDSYRLVKEAKRPAERRAVEILRENKESLHLFAVTYDPAKQSCTISGWNARGCRRRTRSGGGPPKLGSAGELTP